MAVQHPTGKEWTITELQTITPASKGNTLPDGGGLVGEVRVAKDGTVSVRFKYAFKWQGKVCWFQCGTWPATRLSKIRRARDDARRQVRDGKNPTDERKAERIRKQQEIEETIRQEQGRLDAIAVEQAARKTVADLFAVWVVDGVARVDGNKELRRLFGKDVLPVIGRVELRNLTDNDIRAMLRKMVKRGVARMAVVAFRDVRQMLAWGEKRQPWRGLLMNGNPADLVEIDKILPADYEDERNRVLSPAEIRELAGIFARLREDYEAAPAGTKYDAVRPMKRESELALWICLGTLARIGELLMAEWKHVDLDTGVWFIPKANVKGRGKRKQDHYVFLSDFAKRQFEALHDITGESRWCFPARNKQDEETHVCVKSISKQVGDRQEQFKQRSKPLARRRHDNTLVLAGGENGEWTPHDMRRTGATMMQAMGVALDVIDRCQNHMLPGKVRRVYLRHDYEREKTDAWKCLGDRLDAILAGGADIVTLRRAS